MDQLNSKIKKLKPVIVDDDIEYDLEITRARNKRYWMITYRDRNTDNILLQISNNKLEAAIDLCINELKNK